MTEEIPLVPCPFCHEDVRADARRCPHCWAALVGFRPRHGGLCPLCREPVHPEAVRCKHCKADIGGTATRGARVGTAGRRLLAVRRTGATTSDPDDVQTLRDDPVITIDPVVIGPDTCAECDDQVIMVDNGQASVFLLEGCDDDYCYYANPGGIV